MLNWLATNFLIDFLYLQIFKKCYSMFLEFKTVLLIHIFKLLTSESEIKMF
jgi:hypothetical protein